MNLECRRFEFAGGHAKLRRLGLQHREVPISYNAVASPMARKFALATGSKRCGHCCDTGLSAPDAGPSAERERYDSPNAGNRAGHSLPSARSRCDDSCSVRLVTVPTLVFPATTGLFRPAGFPISRLR